MTSRRVRQQTILNTRRKRSHEKQPSNGSVSPGVKLAARIRKQPAESPPPSPRKPSSPVTTQPFKHPTFHPSSDIEIPIPDTSPRQIRALWRLVMPRTRGRATRGRATRVQPTRGEKAGKKRKATGPEMTSDSEDVEDEAMTITTKDTGVTGLTAVEKWRHEVLRPRGIELADEPLHELALDHYRYFGTDEDKCREWMLKRVESGKNEDTVFLRGGHEFNTNTAQQYTEMVARNLCEEEFATFAKMRLFTTPDFLPIDGNDKAWKAQRTIQLHTPPNAKRGLHWVSPPLLSGEEYSGKDFNLRPDCAYWLSVQSYSKSHRGLVNMVIFTVDDRDATPYLTIEFKKSAKTIEQATNQAIAASSLALFNRFRLKADRLSASKKPWNQKYFDQIRHYMMTFTGPKAIIWVVKLKSSSASDEECSQVTWNGCEAVQLLQCDCRSAGGVSDLVDYINAIHRWGLIHGEHCRRDVKAVLLAKGGQIAKRVSDLFAPGDSIEDDEDEEAVGQEGIEDEEVALGE